VKELLQSESTRPLARFKKLLSRRGRKKKEKWRESREEKKEGNKERKA